MADKTIGALPQASVLTDDSLFVCEYSGTAKKVTGKQFKDFASSSVDVDATLTQPGKAADAAAVADALGKLSEDIAEKLTTEEKTLILHLFQNAAYTADMSETIYRLKTLWSNSADVTLVSISATYSGGDVAVGTAVSELTGITVKATYSDGSTVTVTGYTLSGEIAEGSNTITVNYSGKTTTFTVNGVVTSTETQTEVLSPVLFKTSSSETATYPDITTYEYTVLENQDAITAYKSGCIFEPAAFTGGTLVVDMDTTRIGGGFRFMIFLLDSSGNAYKAMKSFGPDLGVSGALEPTFIDPGTSPGWTYATGAFTFEIPDGCHAILSILTNSNYTTLLDESLKINGSDTKMYGLINAVLSGEVITAKVVKEV